jgi:hypothetical protein
MESRKVGRQKDDKECFVCGDTNIHYVDMMGFGWCEECYHDEFTCDRINICECGQEACDCPPNGGYDV